MNRELLIKIGQILYGVEWYTYLARELDVHPTTVVAWAKGNTKKIPDSLREVLTNLLIQKQKDIEEIRKELRFMD